MDLEDGLLKWRGEAVFDALLRLRHQDAVAEPLPTLLGVVDRHDRPATRRRARRVEDLSLWQAVSLLGELRRWSKPPENEQSKWFAQRSSPPFGDDRGHAGDTSFEGLVGDGCEI